jgi:V/A-type H+/Na+-transporting ATPase subunit D
MREATPTRSTALELADERRMMRQGYEFLDEKRMLLATEMLRQLRTYQARSEELQGELRTAAAALAAAVERHGLDHLQVYPVPSEPPPSPPLTRSAFLGVPLLQVATSAKPSTETASKAPRAIDPSPEAKACRQAFERLIRNARELGLRAGNLRRLAYEYRRTERRAKALENVLMPEVDETIKRIDEQLDTMDREDAIHARRWLSEAGTGS